MKRFHRWLPIIGTAFVVLAIASGMVDPHGYHAMINAAIGGFCVGAGIFNMLFPLRLQDFNERQQEHLKSQFMAIFKQQFEKAKEAGLIPPEAEANISFGDLPTPPKNKLN
jgi:hypothetical protein